MIKKKYLYQKYLIFGENLEDNLEICSKLVENCNNLQ